MNGPVRRVSLGVFAGFFALLLAVTWIQVIRADSLRADPRNSRPALAERGKERGLIVAIDGTVLAESVPNPEDERSFMRVYPEGEPFAHVVGYNSFLVGSSGLENAYADELRSRRDLTISDLVAVILGRDLRPESLELTIDADLQRAAFRGLNGLKGGIVALDPRTGAVLASVSSPSYDPNTLLGADAAAVWEDLLADPDGPLLDRATREIYPPGATFKTVVTAAALETGTAVPETVFPDPEEFQLPGSTATISNAGGGVCNNGESITLLLAFIVSCNTTFADLPNQLAETFAPVMSQPVLFMALMMVFLLFVGTAMDLTPTILIFGPVCVPLAVKAGIDPVYFGFMFIFVGCLGLITPPVGTVQNVVAGVGRLRMETVIRGTLPFLSMYLLLLALFVLFPQLILTPLKWIH